AGLGGERGGHQDPPDVVWLPAPCAAEIPEPEPLGDVEPELLAEPAEPDEPVGRPADEPEFCDAAALPVELPEFVGRGWDGPGRAEAAAPGTAGPAAPIAPVAARSRARPCRRAAALLAWGDDPPGTPRWPGGPCDFAAGAAALASVAGLRLG